MRIPATVKGQQSRNAIVSTAARLMQDKGIGATSLDDVLSASGAGRSQLYHYFRNKEELTAAVLQYQFDRIMAAQSSLRDESCADVTQWRSEILHANQEGRFGGCPLGTFAGQVDGSDSLRTLFGELFGQWRTALASLVDRAQRAGQQVDVGPDDAALVLLGALQGGAMLSHVQQDQHALERTVDAALAHIGITV